MNISALLVFGFAVMAAYGYMKVPCSDCSNPCSKDQLSNAIEDFKIMNISWTFCTKYNNISKNTNPTWECKESKYVWKRIPHTYPEAHCQECRDKDHKLAQPIMQDVMMLFKQTCLSNYNDTVLEVKPVSVSLGCTCVNTKHRKYAS